MSAEIERAVKVETGLEKGSGGGRKRTKELSSLGGVRKTSVPTLQHLQPYKKFKSQDDSRYFRSKRVYSFSGGGNAKFFPPHKKRKKVIPPTKFLLGGNIHDPLNLNSLQDEEINRAMNAVTPESSPVPTPQHRKGEVEVIIPPNIRDPLNLADCQNNASPTSTIPQKRIKKKHKRKRQRSFKEDQPHPSEYKSDESKTEETIPETDLNNSDAAKSVDEEESPVKEQKPTLINLEVKKEVTKPTQLDLSGCGVGVEGGTGASSQGSKETGNRKGGCNKASLGAGSTSLGRKLESKDKIVSPVIPQPGAWAGVPSHLRFRKPNQNRPHQPTPSFNENNKRFQYGNYNRYYGYRNPGHVEDPRMKLLAQRRELFEGKDVLDIGCNTGLVTLCVARELGARSVVGLELDRGLVERARSTLSHYSSRSKFPVSMAKLYGQIDLPGIPPVSTAFPHNVSFVQGNYVLQSDVLLEVEQAQFDCILCLSVTKWIHLNWGDAGLKRAFRRVYSQLRPGGVFILEPQPWPSYKRKKNLTETIWRNYQSIRLFPAMFTEYLLSEVGFTKCELIGAPLHHSRGFQRPIKLFTKPIDSSPSQVSAKEESSSKEVEEGPCCGYVETKGASLSSEDKISEACSSREGGIKGGLSPERGGQLKEDGLSPTEGGIPSSGQPETSSSSRDKMKHSSSEIAPRDDSSENTSSCQDVTSREGKVMDRTSPSRGDNVKEPSSSESSLFSREVKMSPLKESRVGEASCLSEVESVCLRQEGEGRLNGEARVTSSGEAPQLDRSPGVKFKSDNETYESRQVKLPKLGDFKSEKDSVGEPRPSFHNYL